MTGVKQEAGGGRTGGFAGSNNHYRGANNHQGRHIRSADTYTSSVQELEKFTFTIPGRARSQAANTFEINLDAISGYASRTFWSGPSVAKGIKDRVLPKKVSPPMPQMMADIKIEDTARRLTRHTWNPWQQ